MLTQILMRFQETKFIRFQLVKLRRARLVATRLGKQSRSRWNHKSWHLSKSCPHIKLTTMLPTVKTKIKRRETNWWANWLHRRALRPTTKLTTFTGISLQLSLRNKDTKLIKSWDMVSSKWTNKVQRIASFSRVHILEIAVSKLLDAMIIDWIYHQLITRWCLLSIIQSNHQIWIKLPPDWIWLRLLGVCVDHMEWSKEFQIMWWTTTWKNINTSI